MRQLRLNPEEGFKKCARVVGDVIGKYHPHGETAVYAPWCAWRNPSPCAIRSSTVRETSVISTASNRPRCAHDPPDRRRRRHARGSTRTRSISATYDGGETEPVVPWPDANGASGIAAMRPAFRRIMSLKSALLHLMAHPKAVCSPICPARTFPRAGCWSRSREYPAGLPRRSRVFGCAPAGKSRQKHGQYAGLAQRNSVSGPQGPDHRARRRVAASPQAPLLADERDESAETVPSSMAENALGGHPRHSWNALPQHRSEVRIA